MLTWGFWLPLFLIIYTYLFFPLLLSLVVRLRGRDSGDYKEQKAEEYSVAILCAMYNEEKVVRNKIENFLQLKHERVKLYIGSDGSSDATNSILRDYASSNKKIVVLEFPRRGKVHVINDLMTKADEDVFVFTDANSMFEPDAISNLLKYFINPHIGAVCGRLKLLSSGSLTGEGFYWRYETMIKKMENVFDCVIGANGAIYAVQKKLLRPLPANTINDDFTNSMRVIEQGYGVKYAEDAVAYEEVSHDDTVEFRRHVRDGAGHYRAMACLYKLLNPSNPKVFFLYVSHRVIRWLVPFFMLLMLVLPLFVERSGVMQPLYVAQVVFYLMVLTTWITKTKNKYLYFPYYFVFINTALFFGFWRTVLGLQKVTWNSTER